jgi:hypothetical protein
MPLIDGDLKYSLAPSSCPYFVPTKALHRNLHYSNLFKIHCNTVSPFLFKSYTWPRSFLFPNKISCVFFPKTCRPHSHPPHFPHFNSLNTKLNPTCHLLALLEAHPIFQISRIRVKSHLPFANIIRRFNVYGSVHCKYIPIYIQPDATLHSLFIFGNCSTCFGWYFHPSSGVNTTVSTASGICHTVTAFCRYHGRAGTGLSVLWVAYTTHSILKPVTTLPR